MSVNIQVEELHILKNSFETALRVINKYITQYDAEKLIHKTREPTTTITTITRTNEGGNQGKKSKTTSLGKCMYCTLRAMKKINNREEFEKSEEKCGKNAYHLRESVMLCEKHKDSNLDKILEVISKSDSDLLEEITETVQKPPVENRDIEEIMDEVCKLEKILTNFKNLPCRVEFRDMLVIDGGYVITPSGTCYGKVEKDLIDKLEMANKRKDYLDIHQNIKPLLASDRTFIIDNELLYDKSLLPKTLLSSSSASDSSKL